MSRPTEFFVEDEMVYWYISIVSNDGTPLDADSNPTVAYRKDNGSGTTTTGVVVTKVGTGLYRARHQTSLDGLIALNTFLHYEESAIISGVTYKNNWTTIVRSVGTLANQTAIKAKTDQFVFTVANQVDANSLTGGTSPSAVADAVWDEAASGHNVGGSFGKFIRQMKEATITAESQLNDASATALAFATDLDSSVNDFYSDMILVFTSGALTGQSRVITGYTGATKTIALDEALTSVPVDDSEFIILAIHQHSKTQIENTVWEAASADHQTAGSTGKALTDASATGGDATAANQNTIIAKLATSSVVYTNPSSPNKLTLIRGDAYDDAAENNGKLTWATGKTLTGATVRFTIRDASDNILIDQTTAGVSTAVDSQTAEVSLTSAATALLTVATTNKFDAEAYWSDTNRWTFARGTCIVLEDQTRT